MTLDPTCGEGLEGTWLRASLILALICTKTEFHEWHKNIVVSIVVVYSSAMSLYAAFQGQ